MKIYNFNRPFLLIFWFLWKCYFKFCLTSWFVFKFEVKLLFRTPKLKLDFLFLVD